MWDANADPSVAGYHVFVGTIPGQPSSEIDAGNNTSIIISNLLPGTTYYFSVTAYSTTGAESLPSSEVSYTTPGTAPAPTPTPLPTATPFPTATPSPTATPLPTATPVPPLPPVVGSGYFTISKTLGTIRNNFTGWVGVRITIGSTPITVNALGRIVAPGNSQSHKVKLVLVSNGSDVSNGSTTVYTSGGTIGSFVYGNLTSPVTLSANTAYYVLTQETVGGDQWYDNDTTVQTASVATVDFAAYSSGASYLTDWSNREYGPVDFVYTTGTPSPTPTPTPVDKNLSNVSTRAYVQTGDNVVIGGFIIVGNSPKRVVIRALGPSLAAAGITNTLSNPTLTLYSPSGAAIGSSDDWRSGPDAATIAALGLGPTSDSESAILATLTPGAYTAKIAGVNGSKGIALLEVDDTESTGSRMSNISTRGRVETGNNIMIGGFIINGSQPTQVLVRALGPSLAKYGVSGTLSDPTLDLYNGNGSKIFSNDNWKSSQKTQITATSLAPTDDRESAILATLAPGNYTAMVRGAKNAVGVALVEVYSVGN